jgi:hypothetical protein
LRLVQEGGLDVQAGGGHHILDFAETSDNNLFRLVHDVQGLAQDDETNDYQYGYYD